MTPGGGKPNSIQPIPDLANLDQAELVSNQQAKALPWFAGEALVAGTWITPVYDLNHTDAGGGKK